MIWLKHWKLIRWYSLLTNRLENVFGTQPHLCASFVFLFSVLILFFASRLIWIPRAFLYFYTMNISRVYCNVVVVNVYLQAVLSSALGKLIRGLPDTLQRQYEYEEPLVRGGKQLFHSDFFKVSTEVIFPFCSLSCSHCVIFFGRSLFTWSNLELCLSISLLRRHSSGSSRKIAWRAQRMSAKEAICQFDVCCVFFFL